MCGASARRPRGSRPWRSWIEALLSLFRRLRRGRDHPKIEPSGILIARIGTIAHDLNADGLRGGEHVRPAVPGPELYARDAEAGGERQDLRGEHRPVERDLRRERLDDIDEAS